MMPLRRSSCSRGDLLVRQEAHLEDALGQGAACGLFKSFELIEHDVVFLVAQRAHVDDNIDGLGALLNGVLRLNAL